jgi:hypothetical protein
MPFKESIRKIWMAVSNNECEYEYYEGDKLIKCKAPAKQVHHIVPETDTYLNGGDPDSNVGLPLCENHHVRNESEDIWEEDASFHPDVSQAFKYYKTWKEQEEHMKSITGRRATDYSTSPFADVAREHVAKAKRGERYISGDEATDNYYEEKMRNKRVIYHAEGNPQPKLKENPRVDKTKRKHWTDVFFGKNIHEEDEV